MYLICTYLSKPSDPIPSHPISAPPKNPSQENKQAKKQETTKKTVYVCMYVNHALLSYTHTSYLGVRITARIPISWNRFEGSFFAVFLKKCGEGGG